jgi:hypothetical protein
MAQNGGKISSNLNGQIAPESSTTKTIARRLVNAKILASG